MPPLFFPGDFFSIDQLTLPRPAIGYGVQCLGTDLLLDTQGSYLSPIRQAQVASFVFDNFAIATLAGERYLTTNPDAPLSIVPIAYDPIFERLVLIQGVIEPQPNGDHL